MAYHLKGQVTRLLEAHQAGDHTASKKLFELVYEDLKKMAVRRMRNERAGHTLQATGLLNEVWIRLAASLPDKGKQLFFEADARMRQVLVDYARERKSRPDRKNRSSDAAINNIEQWQQCDFELLVEPLEALGNIHPRQHAVVMLRFREGLTFEEIADTLVVSLGTVRRDMRLARAWLRTHLKGEN